jgi:hypothetical protein
VNPSTREKKVIHKIAGVVDNFVAPWLGLSSPGGEISMVFITHQGFFTGRGYVFCKVNVRGTIGGRGGSGAKPSRRAGIFYLLIPGAEILREGLWITACIFLTLDNLFINLAR